MLSMEAEQILWLWCAELAGCIIAAVQGQEVVINEATGVDDDDDDEEVEISEDEDGQDDEDSAGFHHFARRPRSLRRRGHNNALGAIEATSDGAPQQLLCPSSLVTLAVFSAGALCARACMTAEHLGSCCTAVLSPQLTELRVPVRACLESCCASLLAL